MRIDGERQFDAPRATVWEVLNDPAQMAKTMPGVESFDIEDDRHWKANVKIPLGLGGLRMSIDFEKLEEREPEYAKLHAKGNGVGAIMSMDTEFHLSEAAGATQMKWGADVRIAGPVGSMGQRVLQPIVNQQVSNVLTALDKQVQEAAGGGGGQRGDELLMGSTPSPAAGTEEPLRAGAAETGTGDVGESAGPATGGAGTPPVTTDIPPPRTDPELKDAGEPAETTPEADPAAHEGTSGAEEGLNPWAPQAYDPEHEGPTTSTEEENR